MDGEGGVGIDDGDVGVEEHVVATAEVGEADAAGVGGVGFGLFGVGDDDEGGVGSAEGGDGDGERVTVGGDVVFDGVFDDELQAEGREVAVGERRVDVLVDAKCAIAVAHLHHADVVVGEEKFFGEGDGVVLLEDVAEGVGEAAKVSVSVGVVDADETVEGVEAVEEEVGRHLLDKSFVTDAHVFGL